MRNRYWKTSAVLVLLAGCGVQTGGLEARAQSATSHPVTVTPMVTPFGPRGRVDFNPGEKGGISDWFNQNQILDDTLNLTDNYFNRGSAGKCSEGADVATGFGAIAPLAFLCAGGLLGDLLSDEQAEEEQNSEPFDNGTREIDETPVIDYVLQESEYEGEESSQTSSEPKKAGPSKEDMQVLQGDLFGALHQQNKVVFDQLMNQFGEAMIGRDGKLDPRIEDYPPELKLAILKHFAAEAEETKELDEPGFDFFEGKAADIIRQNINKFQRQIAAKRAPVAEKGRALVKQLKPEVEKLKQLKKKADASSKTHKQAEDKYRDLRNKWAASLKKDEFGNTINDSGDNELWDQSSDALTAQYELKQQKNIDAYNLKQQEDKVRELRQELERTIVNGGVDAGDFTDAEVAEVKNVAPGIEVPPAGEGTFENLSYDSYYSIRSSESANEWRDDTVPVTPAQDAIEAILIDGPAHYNIPAVHANFATIGPVSADGMPMQFAFTQNNLGGKEGLTGWLRGSIFGSRSDARLADRISNAHQIATGLTYQVKPDVRLGASLRFARGESTSDALLSKLETRTFGVAVTAEFNLPKGFDLALIAAHERSSNEISITGFRGDYDTRATIVSANLSKLFALGGDKWMRPSVSISHTWSRRDSYVNTALVTVPGSSNDFTTLQAGVNFGQTLHFKEGERGNIASITPGFGIAGFWVSDEGAARVLNTGATLENPDSGLNLSGGIKTVYLNGMETNFGASYTFKNADQASWSVTGGITSSLNQFNAIAFGYDSSETFGPDASISLRISSTPEDPANGQLSVKLPFH